MSNAQKFLLGAVGLIVTVLLAKIGPEGAAEVIGVLDDLHRVVNVAGAEVDGVHRLAAGLFRPLKILVVTYVVGDILVPCKV